jgi:hypothetical protein
MAVAIYTANVRFAAVFKGFSGSGRGGWLGPGGPDQRTEGQENPPLTCEFAEMMHLMNH